MPAAIIFDRPPVLSTPHVPADNPYVNVFFVVEVIKEATRPPWALFMICCFEGLGEMVVLTEPATLTAVWLCALIIWLCEDWNVRGGAGAAGVFCVKLCTRLATSAALRAESTLAA